MDRRTSPLTGRNAADSRRLSGARAEEERATRLLMENDQNLPARCWAEVRLDRLAENIASIRKSLGPGVRLISVVKADGYGLGARPLARAIARAGVDFFAVANVAEARELRRDLPAAPVLLLSATVPDEDEQAARAGLLPTLSTADEIERFEAVATRLGRPVPVHFKIDTGMGRLGVWHEAAAPLLRRVAQSGGLKLEGIYTHFASAPEEPEFTALQRDRFRQVLREATVRVEDLLIHADNSGGLESFSGAPFNAARIGLLQLGYPSQTSGSRFPVRPVASLHALVTTVRELPAGAPVSYGRTHHLARPSRLAVVAAGYADGVPRACSNRGAALVRGRRCPILGRVTMDETILDVTDAGPVARGDVATFFGSQGAAAISLEEFSRWADSIAWESLCRLSQRVKRLYRDV